jgi:sugar phosphate isomerase/epimerase
MDRPTRAMLPSTAPHPLDRRTFLGALAWGVAGVGLVGCEGRSAHGARVSGRPLGVQLYTVRALMERGVPETLAAVAGIGYREVETAGLFGHAPEEFRSLLDRHSLVSPAGHVPITSLREDLDAALAVAQTLGQQWVVVPWLDQAERTEAGYRQVAAELNRYGGAASDRGLRIGYHNHEFEFDDLGGGLTGYDILLDETDPSLVDVELDLYWAVKAGRDPVALFDAHPGRFALCHVKDMRDRGGAETQADVGAGDLPFGDIFAHSERAGLRHYFVEHDDPADPLGSIRSSYTHLRQLAIT